jgi:2-polyprenyl-3-methyl-5-hydroxy-6-metoxy-1,4-benzoquinol methylase
MEGTLACSPGSVTARTTSTNSEIRCFCGNSEYRSILDGEFDRIYACAYSFSIMTCTSCGLARTFPVPDDAQYERGYPQTTQEGAFRHRDDFWSGTIAEFVRARSAGGRLLDIGCNVGNLVAAARALGFDARGIDIDPVATAEARRLGRPVMTVDVEHMHERFDVVVLNHVLEHVRELRRFLVELDRIVAPGGRVFIFVPNYRGLIPRLMRANWMAWVPQEHVWHFTPDTLESVVESATSLALAERTTRGVLEPPSTGIKGLTKAFLSRFARTVGWGDQIEAIFRKRR